MEQRPDTGQKALSLNLDLNKIGTFAEIGAGQEVARWFFHAGKASGTVAKSISAYDMAMSDAIYGPTVRYVSRERLEAMLDREFALLVERLSPKRGGNTRFFAYADTVATRSYRQHRQGHGWLGMRFQAEPCAEASEIIIHVELLDSVSTAQQEALGMIGVNLVYGAFYYAHDPALLIASLMDGLNRHRIEIDMIRFAGPAFAGIDNRLMSLQLVEQSLTDATLFTAAGEVVQPSEVLYGRPVVIERGSFRPITNVTLDMLERTLRQLQQDPSVTGEPAVLMEITLDNLTEASQVNHQDFLARTEILGALGKMVLISDYARFDQVTSYLRGYTKNWIAMIVGLPTLQQIFEDKYYAALDGGLLEGLSNLFRGPVRLYVHPTRGSAGAAIATVDDAAIAPRYRRLYQYFQENRYIEAIRQFDTGQLHISPAEVLRNLQSGDAAWETMVPPPAAALIKQNGYFGYSPAPGATSA